MPPTKQYTLRRPFRRTDPTTYIDTVYSEAEVGGDYTGPVDPLYLDPDWPDGLGPLIAEKPVPVSAPSDTSNKEK